MSIFDTTSEIIKETKEVSIKNKIRNDIVKELDEKLKEHTNWDWYWGPSGYGDWIDQEVEYRYTRYLSEQRAKKSHHYFDDKRNKESQKWALKYRR